MKPRGRVKVWREGMFLLFLPGGAGGNRRNVGE